MQQFEDRRQLCIDIRQRLEQCLKHAAGLSTFPQDKTVYMNLGNEDYEGAGQGIQIKRESDGWLKLDDHENGCHIVLTDSNALNKGGEKTDRDLRLIRSRLVSLAEKIEVVLTNNPKDVIVEIRDE